MHGQQNKKKISSIHLPCCLSYKGHPVKSDFQILRLAGNQMIYLNVKCKIDSSYIQETPF